MGARESLFIGLTRSDLFGYVGAACPAPGLTPGTNLSMHPGQLQENQLKPAYQMPYLIMITGGGKDGTVGSQPSVYHNILSANSDGSHACAAEIVECRKENIYEPQHQLLWDRHPT